MSATSTIPITISPEASALVARLGYQREFEEMLDHTLKTVPRVRRVEILFQEDPTGDIPVVMIHPILAPGPNDAQEDFDTMWGAWAVRAYPPQVFEHFVMITLYDDETGNGWRGVS